jgi:hypothetical protein
MSYLAHSKRARIDSFDNNNTFANNSSIIEHKDKLLQHIQSLYLHNDCSDVCFVFGPDVIPGLHFLQKYIYLNLKFSFEIVFIKCLLSFSLSLSVKLFVNYLINRFVFCLNK